jgi:hypothetical protein
MARRPIRKLTLSIRGFDTVNEVAKSRDRRTRPRWGIAGAVALLTALAAPLVTAQPAFAAVPNGSVTFGTKTVSADEVVTVPWTVTQGSDVATHWNATVTGQNGAVVADAGTCDDTSVAVATLLCTFTAGPLGGTYTVTIALRNGADIAAAQNTTVTVAKPTGAVSALNAEVDGSDVSVTWDTAGISSWGSVTGQDLKVVVTVDGEAVDSEQVADNTCTTDAASYTTEECSFTAIGDDATNYTVTVTATNNTGDSTTSSSDTFTVSEPASAPVGAVNSLNAVATGATVEVTWDPEGVTSWGTDEDRGFNVAITRAGGGEGFGTNTCDTTEEPLDEASTGCEFTVTVTGTYTVEVTPVNSIGEGTAESDAVVVSAVAPTYTFNPAAAATADGAEVTVTWDDTDVAWGAGADSTHKFDVVVSPDTITDSTCETGLAKTVDTCTFTATAADEYEITLTPRNTAGSGVPTELTADVENTPPTSDAADLAVLATADGAEVTVTWDPEGVSDWGLGDDPGFAVAISSAGDGDGIGTNGCDTSGGRLPTTATGCTFTATAEDTYTVTVTPQNVDADDVVQSGTAGSDNATTTESAPAADLDDSIAAEEPDDSGAVTVSWDPDDVTWGSGAEDTRAFDVAITGGDVAAGSGAASGQCTTDMPDDTTSCSFTPTEAATYTVTVTPKTDAGSGTPTTLEVEVEETGPTGGVSDLAATVDGATVTVTWDPSEISWGTGANQGLDVAVTGGEVGANSCVAAMETTAETCEFTALEAAEYMITVTPSTGAGEGTEASTTADVGTLAPAAPTDVVVTAGESSLTVSWTAPEDSAIEVTYYTATADPGGATCSTPDADETECTISGLTPGTPYTITVIAHSASGEASDDSETASGTPMGVSPGGMTARNADGKLQMFARGSDGSLLTSVQDENGDWGAWVGLGGGIHGEPVVFRNANGVLQVLVIGLDHAVWQRQQVSASTNSWSAWASTGSATVQSIDVELDNSGVAVIVGRGLDWAVWKGVQGAAGGTSWTWESLGGGVISAPNLLVRNDGSLEVLARGLDDMFWHRVHTGLTWTPWAQVGSGSSSSLAA